MDPSNESLQPIELIVDEFLERQRRGERPTIQEYIDEHPGLASEIQEVLPALAVIEQVAPAASDLHHKPSSDHATVPHLDQVGDYRILREIGRGGMGVVYEAEQQSLGRRVALKLLPRQRTGDALVRFRREARAAARMHHTNIVPVFDVGSDGEHDFYAMQLIAGQGLDQVIYDLGRLREDKSSQTANSGRWNDGKKKSAAKQDTASAGSIAQSLVSGQFRMDRWGESSQSASAPALRQQEPASKAEAAETIAVRSRSATTATLPGNKDLSTAETNRRSYHMSVAQLGYQAASALAYAHARGIIHRDIKPSNLLLDTAGTVWVVDFGLAKTGDEGVTHTGDLLGTIRYMSPERFKGMCDVRADVYSLGLTLYELLTLKPAFTSTDQLTLIERISNSEAKPPRAVDPGIPRDLETIVLKSIDKDPKRRYQSADDLAEDLDRFVKDEPVLARRLSPMQRFHRWYRKNRSLAVSLIALSLFLVVGAVGASVAAVSFKSLAQHNLRLADEKSDLAKLESAAKAKALTLAAEREQQRRAARESEQREIALRQNEERLRQTAEDATDRELRLRYLAEMAAAGYAAENSTHFKPIARRIEPWSPEAFGRDLRGWEWHYLNSLGKRSRLALPLTRGPALITSWSPTGSKVAVVGTFDNRVRILDANTGWIVRTLEHKRAETRERITVRSLCWGRDAKRLLIGDRFGAVHLWDLSDNDLRPLFELENKVPVRSIAWSPDGEIVAAVGADISVRFWRLRDRHLLRRVHHTNGLGDRMEAAWSPDGKKLAITGNRTLLIAVDEATDLQHLDTSGDVCLCWGPQGQFIATAGATGTIRLWDAVTRMEKGTLSGHQGAVYGLAWHPDGTQIASAGYGDATIRIWDVRSEVELANLRAHETHAMDVDWSPDGTELVSGGWKGNVHVWNAAQVTRPLHYRSHASVSRIVSSRDTRRVLALDKKGLSVVGVDGEELLRQDGRFSSAGWADGGKSFWTFTNDSHLIFRNANTATIVRQQVLRPKTYLRLARSHDGRLMASIHQDGTINLRENTTGTLRCSLRPKHEIHMMDIAFSPDDSKVVFLGNAEQYVVDTVTGAVRSNLVQFDTGQRYSPAWSSDSKRLATGNASSFVRVFDFGPTPSIRNMHGHTGHSLAVCWSPDGSRLASGGSDGTVRVWDTASGRLILSLRGHVGPVNSIVWDIDGRYILSGGNHGIRIWDATASYRAQQSPILLADVARRLESNPRDLEALQLEVEIRSRQGQEQEAELAAEKLTHQLSSRLEKETSHILAGRLAMLLADCKKINWRVLSPDRVESKEGAVLTQLEDQTILAGGRVETRDVYYLTFTMSEPVGAIRLETIPHHSLPQAGSGRSPQGLFNLAEFRVWTRDNPMNNGNTRWNFVQLSSAVADYTAPGSSIENAIDQNSGTRWKVSPLLFSPHHAIFELKEPLARDGNWPLRVEFEQLWPLGRFRLSVTEDPAASFATRIRNEVTKEGRNGYSALAEVYANQGQTSAALDALKTLLEQTPTREQKQDVITEASRWSGRLGDLIGLDMDGNVVDFRDK